MIFTKSKDVIPHNYSRPKPLVSRQYRHLSQQTQPRFPLLFNQRSPSDPCPLVNDFITQMVKRKWDTLNCLPRTQPRPDERERERAVGIVERLVGPITSNHVSKFYTLSLSPLRPSPGQTRAMSLVRSLILFISNVAANHACRAPLALPAWARAARGGRRSTVAPFNRCSVHRLLAHGVPCRNKLSLS